MRPRSCATRRCSALQLDAKPKQTPSCSSKSSLPCGREAMTNRPNPETPEPYGRNARSRPMTPSDTLHIAAELVAPFVSNNHLPAGELPALIQTIHVALTRLRDGWKPRPQKIEEPPKRAPSRFSHSRSNSRYQRRLALKAHRTVARGEGRLLAGPPSNFRRSLRVATGIVIDRKIGVYGMARPSFRRRRFAGVS
jgi:ROS/MUCR transcriptional regulator protein